MGLTFNLGRVSPSVFTDSSLNVGIGAAPSGTYKLEVTGTAKVSSNLVTGGYALIGTTASTGVGASRLQVTGAATAQLLVSNTTSSGHIALYTTGVDAYITKNTGSGNMYFGLAPQDGSSFTSQITITSAGNVGIGTSSPSQRLSVLQNTETWASSFLNSNGTESVDVYLAYGSGHGIAIDSSENDSKYILKAMAGTGGGGGKGSVPILYAQCNGNVGLGTDSPSYRLQLSTDSAGKPNGGSWANSSDIRLKENIKTIDNALDKIMQLRGVTFDWKDETEQDNIKESAGFIADEVMLAFPNWVRDVNASSNQKELINDDKVKSLSLPFEFDAMLVEAIKELSAQNQDLKSRLDKAGL